MNAFPSENMASQHRSGMLLRDYFAAKAMTGFLNAALKGEYSNNYVAEQAYRMADAMMKAREA
jgi:hypothetical protein